jgi:hypothetical protein
MSLETEKQRKRRQLIDRIEREITRDYLSLITLQVTIETGRKHSRSEALREVLLKYFEMKPEVRRQIMLIDEKRNLKDSQ